MQRYRFRTVAISGCSKVHKFLWALDVASGDGQGMICHLFLFTKDDHCGSECSSAVTTILRLAAPTLQSLTCLTAGKDGVIYDAICSTHFPHLRHLTIDIPLPTRPDPASARLTSMISDIREEISTPETRADTDTFPSLSYVRFNLTDHPSGTFAIACALASQLLLQSHKLSSVQMLGLALNAHIPDVTQQMLDKLALAGDTKPKTWCQCLVLELLDNSPSCGMLASLVRYRMRFLACNTGRKDSKVALPPSKPRRTLQEWKEEWLRHGAFGEDLAQDYEQHVL
ncbi:hypothetical protein NEOLEDRAFT_313858 [Neolentinus lepideus HHB14362 ss-1]|uniref:Uncharacterized protein n=1 Tax=Neolentinus lepideus HHB14362 ss-1 TaxID=1314782 RepID=A0A165VTH4_9AGAM|nr:hypothetical protein NEOLEDRAFT_313858 [Neolentinus lepideus HHB14362 ss-1]